MRGTARVNTSGGSIEIDAVTGEIYAATSGGGVDIRGAGNRVEAHRTIEGTIKALSPTLRRFYGTPSPETYAASGWTI